MGSHRNSLGRSLYSSIHGPSSDSLKQTPFSQFIPNLHPSLSLSWLKAKCKMRKIPKLMILTAFMIIVISGVHFLVKLSRLKCEIKMAVIDYCIGISLQRMSVWNTNKNINVLINLDRANCHDFAPTISGIELRFH